MLAARRNPCPLGERRRPIPAARAGRLDSPRHNPRLVQRALGCQRVARRGIDADRLRRRRGGRARLASGGLSLDDSPGHAIPRSLRGPPTWRRGPKRSMLRRAKSETIEWCRPGEAISVRAKRSWLMGSRLDERCVKTSTPRRRVVPAAIRRYDRHAAVPVQPRPLGEPKDYGGRPMSIRTFGGAIVGGLLMMAAMQNASAQAPQSPTPAPTDGVVRAETIARGLEHPWGLAFLPDGRMLVTERPGRLRIVDRDGRLSDPSRGVPDVAAGGQGGLLDVVIDPALRREPLDLPLVRRAGRRRRRRHRGRARTARRGARSRTCA